MEELSQSAEFVRNTSGNPMLGIESPELSLVTNAYKLVSCNTELNQCICQGP